MIVLTVLGAIMLLTGDTVRSELLTIYEFVENISYIAMVIAIVCVGIEIYSHVKGTQFRPIQAYCKVTFTVIATIASKISSMKSDGFTKDNCEELKMEINHLSKIIQDKDTRIREDSTYINNLLTEIDDVKSRGIPRPVTPIKELTSEPDSTSEYVGKDLPDESEIKDLF